MAVGDVVDERADRPGALADVMVEVAAALDRLTEHAGQPGDRVDRLLTTVSSSAAGNRALPMG